MVKRLTGAFKANKTIFLLSLANVILIISFIILIVSDANEDSNSSYPLLATRIFTKNQNDYLINFTPLRSTLREMVAKTDNKIGLYFEYLPTGTSININGNDEHKFASLLKIPLVMAYYLQTTAEHTPFDQTFTITQDELDSRYGDLYQKGAGTKITTKELIDQTLIYSDDTATNVLADNIKTQYMQAVFDGLDITINRDNKNTQIVSPKTYSSIYKALYLSSVLPKEDSESILETLQKTQAKESLQIGIPTFIPVANKIGVLEGELYWDCGIVYVPKRPYNVCIISTYSDMHTSQVKIGEVSKTIYDFVSKANN